MRKSQPFKISTILLLLISAFNGFGQTETTKKPVRPCRQQPNLVGECFYVRGRLSLYNGNPAFRLWKVGTKRILGVSDSYSEDGYSHIPDEITSQLNWENELWGNFLICPFTRQKPKVMQMICIESGKDIIIRNRQ